MGYFEYKVVPAPTHRRRGQRRVDGLDRFASTVADILTELGLEGWDFVGAEVLRERRRRFLMVSDDLERTFLVFRRPGSLHRSAVEPAPTEPAPVAKPAPVAEPVAPRRVQRPGLVAEVAAGARRIHVRNEALENTAAEATTPEAAAPGQPPSGKRGTGAMAAE